MQSAGYAQRASSRTEGALGLFRLSRRSDGAAAFAPTRSQRALQPACDDARDPLAEDEYADDEDHALHDRVPMEFVWLERVDDAIEAALEEKAEDMPAVAE